ncbi:MAG: hypothetical protein KDA25_13645 [Phycisphaerales bacterium]|nr:hypothetical protein [Phycisphaerales bacterium]
MVRPCICTKSGATWLKVASLSLAFGLAGTAFGGGNPACGPDAGPCDIANGTPGCDDVDCCNIVCAVDPFCCDTEWDGICAGEAADLCGPCNPNAGPCDAPNGTPGCDDPFCCETVCAIDSFCCDVEWDQACADEAAEFCGAGSNDDCAGRIDIGLGDLNYDTTGANTDGLPHAGCQFDGQTYHDIWFNFTAPADGLLTVSTCNQASYDTDLVVYEGCDTADCPPGDDALLACNDDGTGCAGFSSEVEVLVTAGNCYKIRVGGWNDGDQGAGTLTLSLGDPPSSCLDCTDTEGEACGDDTNGGCNSTPVAFGAIECGETICGNAWADGGTRDTDWFLIDIADDDTGVTATLTSEFNGVVFVVGGIANCAPVVLGQTGSSEQCVVIAPATACLAAGQYVIFVAPAEFEGLPCGGELNDYEVTVECVAGCDQFPACNPDAGPCDVPNGTPGCDDEECCATVCSVDPFCCDTEWDQLCADQAAQLCGEPCDLVCDPGSSIEDETCGDDTNGGCNGTPVAFGAIDCGETVCGTGWAEGGTRDTDWYLFETTADCTNVTASLTSEFSGVVFIVGGIDVCAPVVLGNTGSSSFCNPIAPATAQVGPGQWVVFVAPSVFEGIPCDVNGNDYEVTLTCEECVLCDLVCDPGSSDEGETCGDDTNGGCNSTPVAFGAVECGETICGTGWADAGTRDTDWFLFTVDEDATVTADLVSEFNGVVFIVDGIDACAPVVIGTTGSANECAAIAPASAAVLAGVNYVLFVAPAVFEGVPCGGQNDYEVTLTCGMAPEAPENDDCVDRIEILDGATDYSTIGATTDGLPHASCQFDGQTYNDIWYNYTATVDGTLTVSTCNNAAYDTDLAVYAGCDTADCPPGDDALIACNDDFTGCAGFTSEVTINVVCGNCYKIRVGGWNAGDSGAGTVTLTPVGEPCGGCPCVWDLDGNCQVGPADLAILLANWNAPYGPADLAALLAEWNCSG